MQIESLTQERLEELRKLWMGTTDPTKKAEITTEGRVIKAYLLNPKWGSLEVEGNGWCHTCHEKEARVGHYNCPGCAGEQKVTYYDRNVVGMQQAILDWPKSKLTRKTTTEEDVMNIFGT